MKIYKYTPHIIDFIQNCSLKFTPPYQLNDPFELKTTPSFLDEAMSAAKEYATKNTILTPEILGSFEHGVKHHNLYNGVLSLSRNWSDLKMWGHYTNNFSGGVIEFEIADPPNSGKSVTMACDLFDDFKICGMRNVIYSANRPRFKSLKNITTTLLNSLFRKPAQWKYENEFRIIGNAAHPNFFKISKEIYKDIFERAIKADHSDFDVLNESSTEIFISYKDSFNLITAKSSVEKLFNKKLSFHPLVRVNPLKVTGLYLGMNFDLKTLKDISIDKFKAMQSNIFIVKPDIEKYVLIATRCT